MIRPIGIPTVLLAGGGTGGHLFPGVAVAERLAKRMPGSRVLLAATAKDAASRHFEACPLETVDLTSPRLPSSPVQIPGFGVRMAHALTKSYAFLREREPDLVIGLGGYGSVAPVLAARSRRIPAIVLEQNAKPGRATSFLARFGAVVAASFAGLERTRLRGRIEVTGNPLRECVLAARPAHAEFGLDPTIPVLGVLGGSLGAHGLNERVAAGVPALVAAGAPFQVLHAAGGDDDTAMLAAAYARAGVRSCVRPFILEMGAFYGTVDAVVSRAGGTTVAELAALGVAPVFVPYPHATDDHQRANAAAFVDGGAATMLDECELTPQALVAHVAPLVGDADLRRRRARAARALGRPDAADRVVDLVLSLAGIEDDAVRRSPPVEEVLS